MPDQPLVWPAVAHSLGDRSCRVDLLVARDDLETSPIARAVEGVEAKQIKQHRRGSKRGQRLPAVIECARSPCDHLPPGGPVLNRRTYRSDAEAAHIKGAEYEVWHKEGRHVVGVARTFAVADHLDRAIDPRDATPDRSFVFE